MVDLRDVEPLAEIGYSRVHSMTVTREPLLRGGTLVLLLSPLERLTHPAGFP